MAPKSARCQIKAYSKTQHLQDMLLKACEANVYAIDSNMTGLGYAYDDGCMAIISTTGWMKMPIECCKAMAKELLEIIADVEDIKKNRNHDF